MPTFGPIARPDLIRGLRAAGFVGPLPGRRHQVMRRPDGSRRLTLPNPHGGDISTGLLASVLRQAGISRDDWEKL